MIEPIFLEPIYKDYIWGGKRLKSYLNKNTPYEKTAESWEVSTNSNGKSTIRNGEMAGKTLDDIFYTDKREEVFGIKSKDLETFPLLVKFIDAETNLSVQVHPDDEYAERIENSLGKTEMWYIMDCSDNAQLICGMKEGVKQEELTDIFKSDNVSEYLNFIDIKKGDYIYIPSGTIHAILGGSLICEIQQNSDITYRVYDWGRMGKDGKPRELHVQKSIDVTKVDNRPNIQETANFPEGEKIIVSSEYFKTSKVVVNEEFKDESNKDTFYIMNIVNGSGKLIYDTYSYEFNIGDSFIIPANLGKYSIIRKNRDFKIIYLILNSKIRKKLYK